MRRYFIIQVPNENVIDAMSVRLGDNVTDTYNADNTELYVKTTNELISDSNKSFNSIFPPAFTTEYTLDEVRVELKSWYPEIVE